MDGLHQQPSLNQLTAGVGHSRGFHHFEYMMMGEVETRQIYLQNKDEMRFKDERNCMMGEGIL